MNGKKKDNFYYFMKDVLACFPNKFGGNFIGMANHHFIVKEATRQILSEEIKQKKPQFRILAGALILQNNFLWQMPRVALYEVIDIASELKHCFYKDSRKTIKNLSALTIIRLFVTLYYEYVIMPGRKEEGKEFLNKFKNIFSKEDIIKIISIMDSFRIIYIFEQQGIDLKFGKEANKRLIEVIEKFYEK